MPQDRLRIRVLGGFEVRVGDSLIVDGAWRSRKAAAIIKLLALQSHSRMARDRVIEFLWPEAERGAGAKNLYNYLSLIRTSLQPTTDGDVVRLRGGAIELDPDTRVDLQVFEAAARGAVANGGDAGLYQGALALYSGELLPDDAYEDWTYGRRGQLSDLVRRLRSDLGTLHAGAGRTSDAISVLKTIVADDPGDEGANRRLMLVYANSAAKDRAVRQYETAA